MTNLGPTCQEDVLCLMVPDLGIGPLLEDCLQASCMVLSTPGLTQPSAAWACHSTLLLASLTLCP